MQVGRVGRGLVMLEERCRSSQRKNERKNDTETLDTFGRHGKDQKTRMEVRACIMTELYLSKVPICGTYRGPAQRTGHSGIIQSIVRTP